MIVAVVGFVLELPPAAIEFGGLNEVRSASVSRTVMVPELTLLLQYVPATANADAYRRAAVAENALLKPTIGSRRKTYASLRDRYGLDPTIGLFRALRRLAELDPAALPQLAILTAAMRDPLIRATFGLMRECRTGDPVATSEIAGAIETAFPCRFNAMTLRTAAERVRFSWHQSGHLTGPSSKRVRAHPPLSPATIAMGLLLGDACGIGGSALLECEWILIQDASATVALDHTRTAAGRGWIELREGGGILDVTFRGLLGMEDRA